MSLPFHGWLERPWPRRSWATQRKPLDARWNICVSPASALNGQPRLKTIVGPEPQSLMAASLIAGLITSSTLFVKERSAHTAQNRMVGGTLTQFKRNACHLYLHRCLLSATKIGVTVPAPRVRVSPPQSSYRSCDA